MTRAARARKLPAQFKCAQNLNAPQRKQKRVWCVTLALTVLLFLSLSLCVNSWHLEKAVWASEKHIKPELAIVLSALSFYRASLSLLLINIKYQHEASKMGNLNALSNLDKVSHLTEFVCVILLVLQQVLSGLEFLKSSWVWKMTQIKWQIVAPCCLFCATLLTAATTTTTMLQLYSTCVWYQQHRTQHITCIHPLSARTNTHTNT